MQKIYLLLTLIFLFSCNNQEEVTKDDNQQIDYIKFGKELAAVHNEGLTFVYNDLKNATTRASFRDKSAINNLVLGSIEKFLSEQELTRSESVGGNILDCSTPIEEIAKALSPKESYFINKALSISTNEDDIEKLLLEVSKDNELTEESKLSVICFITTLCESTKYWDKNLIEWDSLTGKVYTRSAATVAVADAWWAYQGLMASGLNIFVGAGSAILASACTAIF